MGAFNGTGTFVRSYSWVADKSNGLDITASRFDTEDNGFAAGLSLCVTRDGQGKMAADFLPSASASYNLGTSAYQWVNGNFSGAVTVPALNAPTSLALQIGGVTRATLAGGLVVGTQTGGDKGPGSVNAQLFHFGQVLVASAVTDTTNATNITSGVLPNGRLSNIANSAGFTIVADPGGTPTGTFGQIFAYY